MRSISHRQSEAIQRFVALLPRDKDPVLLVLKGHLLVEEQLRLLVAARVARPEALVQAKLECYQVICLAEAFCAEQAGGYPHLWDALRKLNTLRNDIAHKLEPKGIADRMANIVSVVEKHSLFGKGGIAAMESSDPLQQFGLALWVLFSQASGLVERPGPSNQQLHSSEPQTL